VGGAVGRDEKGGGVQLLVLEARRCPRLVCADDIFAVATVHRALIGGVMEEMPGGERVRGDGKEGKLAMGEGTETAREGLEGVSIYV
jgi:hypothetical protein